MPVKKNAGQAAILTIFILGTTLAGLVYWGWSRDAIFTAEVNRVDASQVANEVLTAASKRVQQIYMNDSSCDADVLETNLKNLPTLAASYSATVNYVVANPNEAPGTARRNNLCTAASGCRQFVIEQDNRAYIVTVGLVAALAKPVGVTGTCPQDTIVRLKTTIRGFAFSRKVSLINLCSYKSCVGPGFDTSAGSNASLVSANTIKTTACGLLPQRQYGDIVGTDSTIDENDLRWARRYLESGGADIGFTNYMATTSTITSGNGSCAPGAPSSNQCKQKNCIPAFDLDLNGSNNEADLAIMEYYLRGFLTSLPVRNF